MSSKTLSIISSALTVIILILLGIVFMFMLLVILNGFNEREGGPALLVSVVCQSISLILAAILSGKLTRFLVERHNWNGILSVLLSIFAGIVLFFGTGIVSFFLSVIVAENLR